MKKHLQILALFAALILPRAMWGQTDSLTVANGTVRNQYVPVYSYFMDNPMKTQCIYPDDSLTSMRGMAITQLKFYSAYNKSFSGTTEVSLGITSRADLSSAWTPEPLQTIWTGHVAIANHQMVITLDTPFEYPTTGGNLVVQFFNSSPGNCGTSDDKFYGVTLAAHARYATSGTSAGTVQNFLPKCTFSYAAVSCNAPSRLRVSNVTAYSADLSFSSSGSSWAMHITPAINDVSDFDLTDTAYVLSNLTPNTTYSISLRNVCSGADSSLPVGVSFRTPCIPLTSDDLPYTEDFESYSSGSSNPISPCWVKGTNSATAYPYPSSTAAISGSIGLYFYGSYPSTYSYAALPPIDASIPVNTLQLSFDAQRYGTTTSSYHSIIVVGVMTDPNDISTFDTVQVINLTAEPGNSVHNIEAPLNRYAGNGAYVAFLCPVPELVGTSSYAYNYIYIDNVVLDVLPSCIRPVNLVATDVQPYEVTLSWQPGANESSWIISDGSNEYYTTDTFYTVTELLGNTNYTFSVRSYCDVDDTSTAAILSLRTECGEMVLPFFENFDAYAAGSSNPVPCWSVMNGTTWSNVYVVSSYQSSSPNSLGFYSGERYVATPRIPLPANMVELSFMMKAESTTSSGTMMLGYCTSPTDSIVWFDTIQPSNTSWNSYEVSLANLECTDTVHIVFHQNYNNSNYYYWIDDVSIRRVSACPHVENMAYNFNEEGTVVSWTEMGEASYWQLAITTSPNISSINEDSIFDAYEESYTFTDLANGTTYYVFIRPECFEDVDWYGPLSFTPGSVKMPVVGTQSITGCNLVVYDDGGSDGVYSNNCNGYLTVYPSASDSLIGFYGNYYTESTSFDYLVIYEGVNASGNVLFDQRESGYTSQTLAYLDTMVSNVGPITIYFHSDASGQYAGFEIHTFCVAAPECGEVTDITVQTSPNSAFVSWTPGFIGEYAGATVEYRESDDSTADWTSLPSTSETFIGITGLTPTTSYDIRIQSSCAAGEGGWTMAQFMTGAYDCILMDSSSLVQDTIGNGSTTSSYYPTDSYYNYSVSQQIYLASDFDTANMGGVITNIGFQLGNMVSNRDWNIFVSLTNQTNLTNAFIPISASDLVWSGNTSTLTANAWNEIVLPSPITLNDSNILVTFQDMTGSYTSGNQGIVTNTSIPGISRYIYQDSGPYDPTSAITDGTATTNRLNMYFYGGTCLQQQTCAAPIVRAEGTAVDQITLNWVPGNVETSWNVYYRAAADSVYTLAGTATANTYVLNNLQPSSQYFLKVASVCGSDEGAAAELDCWTACGLTQTPFFEDFENEPYGIFSRTCWKSGTTNMGTDYPYPYVISLTGDPNKLCLLFNGGYLVLPEFDAPLNTLQARFTLVQGAANVRLMIGLLENLDDPISSIIPLDTLIRSEIDPVNSSVTVTFPFDMLPDSISGHIVFYDAWNDNYNFLDNINIEPIPSCPSVSGVTVSNVTSNSADVSWEASAVATASYLVEYGPYRFTPGTGTMIATSTNSVVLSGLTVGTSYDVYVYAVCSAADTSFVSNVASFVTECGAVTLPYTENFDNVLEPGAGSSTKKLPNCWNYVMTNSSYSSSSYYPTAYYTTSTGYTTSGNYCLWLYGEAVTVLPEMPATVDNLMITFHEHNTSPSSYQLIVGAVDSVTPGYEASFVGLDTISGSGDYVVFLNNYTGTGRYIAFKNINTNGSGYSYHYIDDIVVENIPSCIYPLNFSTVGATTTTADIAWTTSNATDYEYEYGPAGFTRGTGTTGTCIGRLASISGLTISTTYDIYVRGICGAGDTSAWSMYTFHTLNADPISSFPFYCDFSDSTRGTYGFELVNGSQTNKWYVGNAVSNGTPRSLYISNDNGTSHAYTNSSTTAVYAFRDFSVAANAPYFISFDWMANGESNYDYIRAFLAPVSFDPQAGTLPDGGTSSYNFNSSVPAGWIALDGGSRLNGASNWNTNESSINLAAGTYRFVLLWANDASGGSNPPAAIDNIIISPITCPRPYDFNASATASTIALTWSDSVQGTGYEVEYGAGNFAHGDGIILSTTTPSITLTGLDALTNYTIYVRHICSATDTGMWAKTVVRTDMCDGVQIAQNFDTATSTLTTSSYMPAYSFYNHSFSQSIIPASDLAGLSNITAFAFLPASTTAGDYYTNCEVYLAHTSLSEFSYSDDVVDMVDTNSTLVYSGDLNYTSTDWRLTGFDTPFEYDGTSNVIITIVRNHGGYLNGCSFNTVETSGLSTIYGYSDDYTVDASSLSLWDGSIDSEYEQPLYRFYSCGVTCAQPAITSVSQTYEDITLNWSASNDTCEVAIAQGLWVEPTTTTQVIGSTYTFAGLTPATTYSVGVRQLCAEGAVSDWTVVELTTDSLPCFAPEALAQTAATYRSVTLSWTAGGEESHWQVRVYNTTFDSIYDAATTTATVSGLQPGITYSAAVRALCGNSLLPGDWSETITVTTADCQPVTNVRVTNVTAQAATITWTAGGSESAWVIEYSDMPDFATGTGTIVNAGSNPFDLPLAGFEPETEYYFYVYAQCDASLRSVASNRASFTTQNVGIDDVDATRSVSIYPNPATHAATLTLSGVDGQLHIDIVDMNGRKVQSLAAVADGGLTTTLDLSTLAQGAYFVRIYGDNFSSVKKLVVR